MTDIRTIPTTTAATSTPAPRAAPERGRPRIMLDNYRILVYHATTSGERRSKTTCA